ncbi:MAG: xylulokinase [Clostridia bacterium]|nr:xylulokinase [Clostridia bacterium]
MLYIGIDLGTSSMKALLMDKRGSIISSASHEYPLEFPRPGWSQQNPDDWWSALRICIKQLLDGVDACQIAAIAVSGQMHGLVTLDKNDGIIRPAILWNDGRTQKQADEMNKYFGTEGLLRETGNIAFAGFTAPKIVWMYENERENFERIDKIMLPKDYLVYRMTGRHVTDYSDASGMLLLDVKNRIWSKSMLDYCRIGEDKLPRLCESFECVGMLKPEAASFLGLPETVRVAAGGADNACSAIGTGTMGDGKCNISLGTSGTVFISSDSFRKPQNGSLHSFAHADGKYYLMGCILSAASGFGWWSKNILRAGSEADEQREITEDDLGSNRVFYLPYLMGERSPHNNTFARGAFIGLSMDTTRSQMSQAVMEGVAFAIRDCVEAARELGLDLRSSGVCGGGAKSPVWRRILANVLKIQLEAAEQEQGAGLGAGILAMVAAGEYGSPEAAFEAIGGKVSICGWDEETAKRYEARYQTFKKLYPALKPTFPEMSF